MKDTLFGSPKVALYLEHDEALALDSELESEEGASMKMRKCLRKKIGEAIRIAEDNHRELQKLKAKKETGNAK